MEGSVSKGQYGILLSSKSKRFFPFFAFLNFPMFQRNFKKQNEEEVQKEERWPSVTCPVTPPRQTELSGGEGSATALRATEVRAAFQ